MSTLSKVLLCLGKFRFGAGKRKLKQNLSCCDYELFDFGHPKPQVSCVAGCHTVTVMITV